MHVAAVALALVVLGHEGDRLAMGVGDLLGPGAVDRVVVAGALRLVVQEADLLLAEVALPLDALAVHARAVHRAADVPQQRLHPGRGVQGVVDVVVARGHELAVALAPGLAVGLVEHEELELGGGQRLPAALGEAFALPAQDLPRGRLDGIAVQRGEVRGDHHGALDPRDGPQGREVRDHRHVAVAGLPAGDGVAVDGVHVDVDRQQVVAALGAVLDDGLEEVARGDPLAHEASLHVRHGQHDGVDLPVAHPGLELLEAEESGRCRHVRSHRRPQCRVLPTIRARGGGAGRAAASGLGSVTKTQWTDLPTFRI